MSPIAAQSKPTIVTDVERQAERTLLDQLGVVTKQGSPIASNPYEDKRHRLSWIVPSEWYVRWMQGLRQQEPLILETQEWIADLSILHQSLEEGYGGFKYISDRGFDWLSFFKNWLKSLEGSPEQISTEVALAPWFELKKQLVDNHTGPALGIRYQYLTAPAQSQTYLLPLKVSLKNCEKLTTSLGEVLALIPNEPSHALKTALNAQMEPQLYFVYPNVGAQVASVICEGHKYPIKKLTAATLEQISNLHRGPHETPSVNELDEATVVIRIPTLHKGNYAAFEQLVKIWKLRSRDHKKIVVDLRRNEGGDGESALGLLSLWFDALQRPHFEFPMTLTDSYVSRGIRYGYTQFTSLGLKPPIPDQLRDVLQGAYDDLFVKSLPAVREDMLIPYSYNFSMRPKMNLHHAYSKRFIVLADQNTASDAEWLTYVLRSIPGTLILGQNTFGVGQFIRPGYFVLPHTGMVFRAAQGVSDLYGDARLYDGYGLDVDILIEDHSASALLSLISKIN